jgi:hypothetical protein
MVGRRTVLKISATTVAVAIVEMPGLARNGIPAQAENNFQRAVFDERFAECRAFAAEMDRLGVLTSAIRGNLAGLWYDDMRTDLRRRPAPIAGLTDRAALFCLEELTRDVNMRVIVRVDHVMDRSCDSNGHVDHATVGPRWLVSGARTLKPGPGFGRSMARLFSRFDLNKPSDASAQKRTGPFAPENKTALVSWVIA